MNYIHSIAKKIKKSWRQVALSKQASRAKSLFELVVHLQLSCSKADVHHTLFLIYIPFCPSNVTPGIKLTASGPRMFMVTELQCGARFSRGWFAAWLCISVEQAAEQQGWVQGAEPLAITSITATAGGLETWMERWMGIRGYKLSEAGGCLWQEHDEQ